MDADISYDPKAPRYHWLVTARNGVRITYGHWQCESDVRACHNINYANWDTTLMADSVTRKDIPEMLSAEELETYEPGHNCTCSRDSTNCTCRANWTPKEVYVLRNMVCDLEKEVDSLKSAVAKNHKVIDSLRVVNTAFANENADLFSKIESLKQDVENGQKNLDAAQTAFGDYVADVIANQDQMQDEYEKFIHKMQNDVVTTNYALNA